MVMSQPLRSRHEHAAWATLFSQHLKTWSRVQPSECAALSQRKMFSMNFPANFPSGTALRKHKLKGLKNQDRTKKKHMHSALFIQRTVRAQLTERRCLVEAFSAPLYSLFKAGTLLFHLPILYKTYKEGMEGYCYSTLKVVLEEVTKLNRRLCKDSELVGQDNSDTAP